MSTRSLALCALLLLWGRPASAQLNTGLQIYWGLNEASGATRVDALTGNDLTDNGTVGATTAKLGANAASFTDTDNFLSRADTADISAGNVDFTIACWVNPSSVTGNHAIMAKGTTGGGNTEYRAYLIGDQPQWIVSNDGTAVVSVDSASTVSTGTYYLMVFHHDSVNNTIGFQINNGTIATLAHTTGVHDGGADFQLGAYAGTDDFAGAIDECGKWSKVLSTNDRTELYNGGTGRAYPFPKRGGLTLMGVGE